MLHFDGPRLLSIKDNTSRAIIEQALPALHRVWGIMVLLKHDDSVPLNNHMRNESRGQKTDAILFEFLIPMLRILLYHHGQIVNLAVSILHLLRGHPIILAHLYIMRVSLEGEWTMFLGQNLHGKRHTAEMHMKRDVLHTIMQSWTDKKERGNVREIC